MWIGIGLLRGDHIFYEDKVMDNQKSNEAKGVDAGRQGAGSSIGKDQQSGLNKDLQSGSSSQKGASGSSGSTGSSSGSMGGGSSSSASPSTSSVSSSGNAGATGGSAAGSSGSMGSSSTGSAGSSASGSTSGAGSSASTGATGGASASGSDALKDAGKDASSVLSSVKPEEMHKSIDKAAEAAQPMVERVVSSAHAGVDKLSGLLSSAQETFGSRQQQVNDTYQQLADSGREYVRNKPGTAIAIAVGVGYVLAKLLGGSNRRDY